MGYHFNVKFVSRGKGESLVAKGAYHARDKFREERTGETKDYTYKADRPVNSFVFVDKKHGAELQGNESLLNAIDGSETQINSQTGLNFTAALPKELTDEERARMVRDFGREEFFRKGIPAVAHIHAPHQAPAPAEHAEDEPPTDNGNHHAHFLAGLRTLGADGRFGEKHITWDNYSERLDQWREKWADLGARYLEKAGYTVEADRWRYGHLTNPEQKKKALERGDDEWAEIKSHEATTHRGPAADAMEKKGQQTERGNIHRDTEQSRRNNAALKVELAEIQKAIAAYEREWQDAVAQAAIEKEKIECRFVELPPERGTLPPPPQQQPPPPAPELGRTAGEIRLAYTLTRTGQQFANALEDRGLILANTTAADAERLNKWEARRMKEQERELQDYQKYRTGELVVVNQHGDVYKLTRSNTGDDAKARAEHLKDIDRAALLSVTAAQSAMQQFRQDRREEKEATRADYYRPEEPPEQLTGAAAKILLAHYRSDSARSFAAALAEKGIALAITTKEDAEQSQSAAAAAFMKGSYAPVYREGEILAVTDRATVYRLNERTTGSNFGDMQRYLRTLDTSTLRGIAAIKQMMHDRAAERGGRGLSSISGHGNREQDILDRTERRTMENERAANTHREIQHTVLDRATRRTMENERAQRPRNTRDS